MADDGKAKISVDVKINPFGEFKGSQAPEWFAARPKLVKIVAPIPVKRMMMLDPRKWKKKTIEDGVYAVARYELALFATALNGMQKDIDKAIPPKERKKKKFTANTKDESKEEGTALSNAEKKVTSLWKKISKQIEDKVSLALDEVESDKGDNKKALAAGKQALKIFERIETKDLFAKPVLRVQSVMNTLASFLARNSDQSDEGFKAALRAMRDIESDYEYTAKSTSKVAKMFLAIGEKIGKDAKADPALQNFGKSIAKSDVKKSLETMTRNISEVGKDIDALVNFLAKGEGDAIAVKQRASKFKAEHDKKKGSAAAATAAMRKLSVEFKKIEKKLK